MTAQTRSTPVGTKLDDGFSTKIAFEADPDISFWEKTVTPPGVDGGDKIPISTMHNSAWRTFAARALKELTDSTLTCAYDPKVYSQIIAIVNVPTEITVHFPDTSTLSFFGFLKSFTPGEMSEGEQPEADIEIVCTNLNPNTGLETAPSFVDNSGT